MIYFFSLLYGKYPRDFLQFAIVFGSCFIWHTFSAVELYQKCDVDSRVWPGKTSKCIVARRGKVGE